MWLVSVTRSHVWMGSRCVKSLSLSHTGHWKFNMAPHGKELSEDLKKIIALHKDGVGYKKIAKTMTLSCSTVAKTIQRFNRTGSSQNRPRHDPPKKLSARAPRHIQRLCLGYRRMSAASIAGGGAACQCSDHTPHTASNRSAWLSSLKEASSKDDAQERVSWSGAAWVLPALGSYSSLRELWMPTCTETYWSRACILG